MDKSLKQLKDYWIYVVAFVGLIIWYADTNSRLTAVEAKQQEQQITISKIDQLSIDMAVVKNDVGTIKKNTEKNND